jgi:hypothetical protein
MRILETEGGGGYSMLDVRVGSEGSSNVPVEQLKTMQAAGASSEYRDSILKCIISEHNTFPCSVCHPPAARDAPHSLPPPRQEQVCPLSPPPPPLPSLPLVLPTPKHDPCTIHSPPPPLPPAADMPAGSLRISNARCHSSRRSHARSNR